MLQRNKSSDIKKHQTLFINIPQYRIAQPKFGNLEISKKFWYDTNTNNKSLKRMEELSAQEQNLEADKPRTLQTQSR